MSEHQAIGVIRFSIMTRDSGSFNIGRDVDKASYKNILFSCERMNKRFNLFETITLPSLDAQTDGNFSVVVCASDYMPDTYKERLDGLASRRRYLSVRYFDDSLPMSEVALECISSERCEEKLVNFRLDDDDALAFGFVSKLKKAAAELSPGQVVTFSHGAYIRASMGGGLDVAQLTRPKLAIGLAHVQGAQRNSTIFHFGKHSSIHEGVLTTVEDKGIWWLRSVYGDSDSQLKWDIFSKHVKSGFTENIDPAETAEALQNEFPLIDFSRARDALL